ncbi:MAG: alcohol dehydrogenase catalytic domain-containing protein [Planctomycetota bacterium]|nr:alcohol dehydrogenase catalytic domain-containing protein [Planctomycetota bacterium]
MATAKKMRAGVLERIRKIALRELPVPEPARGQVLLRVVGCGVCGTDYHIYEGEVTAGVQPPVVLGHEIATRVEAIGPGVDGLKTGQFAAIDPVVGCGCCAMCRTGRINLCPNPTIIGYKLNGGFAQFVLAPATNVVPMDEKVGMAGGVLCETLACVLRGYDRLGFIAGSSAMVLGAGTVGLLWAQMLKSSPGRKLLQTELAAFRRKKAQALGADVVIDPREGDFEQRVRQTLPDGVDFIVDATGNPDAIAQALPTLAFGGTLMIFGICPPGSALKVEPYVIYNKEAKIIGSKMPPLTLERAARLIESGRIACEQIVTTNVGLDQLGKAVAGFNDVRESQVKIAIDPWQ